MSEQSQVSVAERVRTLQERWGGIVRLAPVTSAHTIYDRHAYLFAPAFPGADDAGVDALALAGRLFSTVMFASDNAIDGDEPERVMSPADLLAISFEAYRVLGGILGGAPGFWDAFRSALAGYVQAIGREARYVRGDRLITDFTLAEALRLAEDKAAVACVTVHGLAALSGHDGPVADLCTSIGSYNVVMQLTDDLLDWRQDATAGRPSWLLAEVASSAVPPGPGGRWSEADLEEVGRAVFYAGCARRTMELALDKIADARAHAEPHGVEQWVSLLRHLEQRVQGMRLELPDPTAKPGAAAPQPGAGPARASQAEATAGRTIRLPSAAAAPWRRIAWDALRWLLRQWGIGNGFPDARHIMWFTAREGFTGDTEMQIGDVFSRALLATALAEADGVADGQLAHCLDRDVMHLLNRRHPGDPGLWGYFPELPDLAADADDLAEILRVLTMTGHDAALAGELDVALRLALVDGGHADGSFETWIIPAGAGDALTATRRKQAEQKWGTGADCEVMANLVEAVARYHQVTGRAGAYLGQVDRAADYLVRHQRPDGSWPATWYQTDLYGTWVGARALARLRPEDTGALARAAAYITGAQLPDGGWSVFSGCEESDATGTALALLGLADSGMAGAHPGVAARGQAWLRGAATDHGAGWPSSVLIRMQPGRASGLTLPERTFGCASITASLVLRAALRYDAMDGGTPGPVVRRARL